jgi:hypothetical protein
METGAQREATRIQQESSSTADQGKACLAAASQKPEYAHLMTKTYYGNENPPNFPLRMLNDEARPTKQEIKSIYALYADVQNCRQLVLTGVSKAHPLLVLALTEGYSQSDRLWADFTKGKMTWGQFNTGRKTITEDTTTRLTQANMQIGSQLEQRHESEMEQRRQAAAAFSQWAAQQQAFALQQQAIDAANRPRIINCNYFGNSAQCASN